MHKVLITGASGFVGRELVKEFEKNNTKVIAMTNHNVEVSSYKNIICNLDNIKELPQFIDDRDIDCCIHLAWQGSSGEDRGDYHIQLKNIHRTLDVCTVLPELNIGRFVGIGSLAEKNIQNYIPLDASTPDNIACYGVAKQTTRYMSKIICNNLHIEHIWCHLSNVYGVGDKTNNFINFACKLMLEEKRAAFTEGKQVHDFLYITDAARAIYHVSLKGRNNSCYYLGSGDARPLKEYIIAIRDAVDPNIALHLGEVRFNGICLPASEFDASKLKMDTGFQSEVPFETGIKKTVQWLREISTKNKRLGGQ